MVHLKDFSLVSPEIQSGDVLKAIEMAMANTQTEQERKRSLPAQLVVSLVIAMSSWSRVVMPLKL